MLSEKVESGKVESGKVESGKVEKWKSGKVEKWTLHTPFPISYFGIIKSPVCAFRFVVPYSASQCVKSAARQALSIIFVVS